MGVFRMLACALAIAVAFSGAGRAGEPAGAEDARAVIQSKLDAFQAEQVETAYDFAAPNIRRIFPTPDRFGNMVKNGYPMVWDPAETSFLDAAPRGDAIVQRLRIIDKAGRAYIAEYTLQLIDGAWRIAGVQIEEDNSYGA